MNKKRALIFGISGQDGAYLSKFLLNKGYEVYGTSRDVEGRNFSRLKRLKIFDEIKLYSASLLDFRNLLSFVYNIRKQKTTEKNRRSK